MVVVWSVEDFATNDTQLVSRAIQACHHHAAALLTSVRVAYECTALGVQPAGLLAVHGSLRALKGGQGGLIAGGANAILDGLLLAIGSRGTLICPTHTYSFTGWEDKPVSFHQHI